MNETPEYSISEFLLAALCFAAALSALVWAALALTGWGLDWYFG